MHTDTYLPHWRPMVDYGLMAWEGRQPAAHVARAQEEHRTTGIMAAHRKASAR